MKYKIFKLLSLTLFCVVVSYRAKAQNLGFVQQDRIKISGITTDNQIYALGATSRQSTRTYCDGLGRTVQTIAIQASPLQNDLIQPVAYDKLGRQTTSYMPYAGQSTNAMGAYQPNAITTDQPTFYNTSSDYVVAQDAAPYSQQVFENSPLQRLLLAGMTGSGYQPTVSGNHYKSVVYRANSAAQDGNILVWNPDGTYTTNTYYADNTLSVTDGKDEDNVETLSFTDLAGHVILKRQLLGGTNLDTYYIYNAAGMIRNIVPPKAVALLAVNNYNLTATPLSTLIFYFVYNTRGQMTTKTVPAKGPMNIIYDPLNRPVLMQDANMALNNQWNYIKYDVKGRVIGQGVYVDNTTSPTSHIGPANMQIYVNSLASNYAATWYESRSSTLTNGGYYTNAVFPTGSTGTLTPLAYAYFDNYDMNGDGTADFSYITQGLTQGSITEESQTTASLRGVPTIVSKTTVGLNAAANTWLTTVTFYDKRGNVIQTQKNNHIYYMGASKLTDISTVVPDFTGMPEITQVSKQTASATTVTVKTTLTYDQVYRITAVSQSYNGGTATQVAAYSYNELGQVIKKGLGYVNPTTWLQNLDMRYNIRGQITSINNSKLNSDNGKTNNDATSDVFGMLMFYDVHDTNLGNTSSYNGKLTAETWMSKDGGGNNSYERAFIYKYDGLDRDTSAVYMERTVAATGAFTVTHGWDENRITYDPNGNIMTMFRMTSTQGSGTHAPIDNLTYSYSTTIPNQLLSVADATGDARGFIAGTGTYTYDANGNLTSDPYKGITKITHNVINQIDQMIFTSFANNRFINYTYSADGTLIRKLQYENVNNQPTLENETDYVDGFVFTSNGTGTPVLSYFPMPEGRVLFNNGTFTQEFVITDAQGNARVSFQNNGSGAAVVKQENSYYAFGMIMGGSTVALPTVPNKQLYNGGSEWQNDYSNLPDYYRTFNRNYDAALGRFIGVDPKAESTESMSTYQYANNNPIMNNDPLGDITQTEWNFALGQMRMGVTGGYYIGSGTGTTADVNGDGGGGGDGSNDGGDSGGSSSGGSSPSVGGSNNQSGVNYSDQTVLNNTLFAVQQIFGVNLGLYHEDLPLINITILNQIGPAVQNAAYQTAFYQIAPQAANQGGEVGFRQFIAMAVGETGTGLNRAESAGIASSMINRMNQAGTSLKDPNWIKKISYGGNVNTNFKILMHPNEDYREIMSTKDFPTVQSILNSSNPGIQGAVGAYQNWGTDYSNLNGFADTGLYYWNASRSLSNSTYGSGAGYVITGVQGDGKLTTTFYRPN